MFKVQRQRDALAAVCARKGDFAGQFGIVEVEQIASRKMAGNAFETTDPGRAGDQPDHSRHDAGDSGLLRVPEIDPNTTALRESAPV